MFYIFPHYMTSHITLHLFLWQLGSPPKPTELEMFPIVHVYFLLPRSTVIATSCQNQKSSRAFPWFFSTFKTENERNERKKINLPSIPAVWLPGKCVSNFPSIVVVFFFSLLYTIFRNAICHIFGTSTSQVQSWVKTLNEDYQNRKH